MRIVAIFLAAALFVAGLLTAAQSSFPSASRVAMFAETGNASISNTTNETSLIGSGVGSTTIPANSLKVGQTITIRILGVQRTSGTPTFRVKVKLGGTTILDSGAQAQVSSAAADRVAYISCTLTVISTGASGTVIGQGQHIWGPSTASVGSLVTASAITVDTTAALAIDVTGQYGTASTNNLWTTTNAVIVTEK